MKLRITNRSQWPDWFVKPVVKWIVVRAGISHDYEVVLPAVSSRSTLAGRGGTFHQRSRINRRFSPGCKAEAWGFPYTTKYWRYKWAFTYQLANRLEAFVDIVSHEACHATTGHPSRFTKNGRCDSATMEMTCERFSRDTVEAFRAAWKSELRPKVVANLRQFRRKKHVPSIRIGLSDFEKAKEMLLVWQRKQKLAANKVKKYARRVNYYEKREGRAAAKQGE